MSSGKDWWCISIVSREDLNGEKRECGTPPIHTTDTEILLGFSYSFPQISFPVYNFLVLAKQSIDDLLKTKLALNLSRLSSNHHIEMSTCIVSTPF
jgi:hypothetical protein